LPAPRDEDRIFIEYLGMMDKPEYAARWEQKSREFAAKKILPIESGGGSGGKLIVIDNLRHTDRTSIHQAISNHLGTPLGGDETTTITSEGE
jgi:hypothetical protein